MPSRNRIKVYIPEAYYHVYNRGLNKQVIFNNEYDYSVFLNLLKRYLSKKPAKDNIGRVYESLFGRLELLTFCLMPNHFHLLIYQNDQDAVKDLLHRVTTSYTMYFNKRHKRSGPLFQDRFKASRITNDEYLIHISRYIHLNPESYKKWEFSSLPYYLGNKDAEWVRAKRVIDLFNNDYLEFLEDYVEHKRVLEEIKQELADG